MMINHIYSHCNFDIVGIEFTFSILSVAFNLNQEMFPCNSKKNMARSSKPQCCDLSHQPYINDRENEKEGLEENHKAAFFRFFAFFLYPPLLMSC